LGFTENTLFFNQLTGDHVLEFLGNSKFSYNIAASFAGRDFPDFRRATYGLDSGASAATPYGSYFNGSTGNRTFNDHLDTVYEILPKIEIPFKQWSDLSAKLSVGGGFSFRERDSRTYKFIYEGPNVVSETSLQGILTDSALENGSYKMSDLTTPPDKMKGTSTIGAGFIQIDIPLIRSLRLIGGVRYEYYFMQVHTADLLSNQPRISQIEKNDILPALNIVQALSQDMNLRFAVSRTVTRPDFREISSSYIEKILGSYERGNPDLEPTSITNADIRWEIFPTSAEIIAVSGFYKFLDKPIENVLLMNADKPISYVNAENAKNMGIEIELRENLGFIARAMSNFSLAINGSYIYSRVSLGEPKLLGSGYTNKVRPLQGQSPYIINSIISYDNKDLGTSFSLLYYHFGKRIIVIGSNGIDDMYEQANGKLDLTLKQNIVNDASFKFSVSNILDPQIKTTQQTDLGEKIARSYKKGISMDLSFNYTF
jgi:TonB-dependent receptor